MKRTIIIILLFLLGYSSYAQYTGLNNRVLIDSLKQELTHEKLDDERMFLFRKLAEKYAESNPDSSIHYGEKSLELAQKLESYGDEMAALGFMGFAYNTQGNFPKALELSLEAYEIMEKNMAEFPTIKTRLGPADRAMSVIYENFGEYDKAIFYANRMIDLDDSDNIGSTFGYYILARNYEKLDLLDSALLALGRSHEIFSSLENPIYNFYEVPDGWYNVRAKVYLKQGKDELALKDYQESVSMAIEGNLTALLSDTYNDISSYYKVKQQSDSLLHYALLGLATAEEISYANGILKASEILAKEYESKDTRKAFFYYKMATETRNSFYGAGNIRVMKDMIAQNEKRQQELINAEEGYNNRIKFYLLLAGLIFVLMIAFFLYRNMKEGKAANQILENTLSNLKSTQAQLIQSEKMASLGELTAGIAHEIQNPLNFVNNFSEVSGELIDEMKEELVSGDKEEAMAIADDIKQNLNKINHHGGRASGIVKGMLEHSRTSSGEKERTDINALANEYLKLSYGSMIAKDDSFKADFKTNFDESLPEIEVVSQDIGRVLLNLINNAFQAVSEEALKRKLNSDQNGAKSGRYKPTVTVTTKSEDEQITITVKDNGSGIPSEIKDKIFQPFFTTKDTGKGTGLGLSLAYDIVKAHGGELTVNSKENEGSQFLIQLPLTS